MHRTFVVIASALLILVCKAGSLIAQEEITEEKKGNAHLGIAVCGGIASFSRTTPFPEGVAVKSTGYCYGAELTITDGAMQHTGGLLALISNFKAEDYPYIDSSGQATPSLIPLTDYTDIFVGLSLRLRIRDSAAPFSPFLRFGAGIGGGSGAVPRNPKEERIVLEQTSSDVFPLGFLLGGGLELLAGKNNALTMQLITRMNYAINRNNNSGWRSFGLNITLGYEIRSVK